VQRMLVLDGHIVHLFVELFAPFLPVLLIPKVPCMYP